MQQLLDFFIYMQTNSIFVMIFCSMLVWFRNSSVVKILFKAEGHTHREALGRSKDGYPQGVVTTYKLIRFKEYGEQNKTLPTKNKYFCPLMTEI
jgi:hypothetical protein